MCQTIGLMVYHYIMFNVSGPKFWVVILTRNMASVWVLGLGWLDEYVG